MSTHYSGDPLFDPARRVGYASEEVFSRAFKRANGQSLSHWRSARAADPRR
jgi:AraC-like DNA-binding protein